MNTKTHSKTVPKMQARDSILARFMLGFEGDSLSSQLADYLAQGLAGVIIYQRNFASIERLHNLTAQIRRAAGRPILIGIDQEGGKRFALKEPFTAWPSASELGRMGDLEYVQRIAKAMAMELQKPAGCNLNFAPMLDLHINPDSPVTKDRSFGSDPLNVAEMGVALHRGLRAGGVVSCAKHFPGHGDTTVDPHNDLPVFLGSMDRLESAELIPFAAAVAAGVPLIMTAHILLPYIDPDNPASFSRALLGGLLRDSMEFDGVILADDLGMGAIARRYGPGEAAVETLLAGSDIAMLCHDWSAVAPAIDAVRRAKAEGRFTEAEWSASLERIDRVITQSEAHQPQPPLEIIGAEMHRALALEFRALPR